MTISRFDGINYPRRPLNNITPFTYRDGRTFLEVLEELRRYITNTIVPGVNANFDLIVQNYLDALDQMEAEKVAALASLQSQYDRFTAIADGKYDGFTAIADGKYAELDALHDQYMADVSASLRAMNEPEVAALINDDASTVSVALKGKYARKNELESLDARVAAAEAFDGRIDQLEASPVAYGAMSSQRVYARVSGRTAGFGTVTTPAPQGIQTTIPLAEFQQISQIGFTGGALVVPTEGFYQVSWRVKFTGGTAGVREVRLLRNGSGSDVVSQGYGSSIQLTGRIRRYYNAGDTVGLAAWSNASNDDIASVVADNAFAVTLELEPEGAPPRVAPMLIGQCGGTLIPSAPSDAKGTWIGTDSWKTLQGGGVEGQIAAWVATNPGGAVDVACPMVPTALGNFSAALDEVIAGTRDSVFTTLATNLATHGPRDVYCRLWWEFNIGGATPDAARFIAAWNRIVPLLRSTFAAAAPGKRLHIVWCFAGQSVDPLPWWPDSANVDVVSADIYAMKYGAGSTQSRQVVRDAMERDFNRLSNIAVLKGKPMSLGEWAGVAVNTGSNGMGSWYGRGDDPDLIDYVFDRCEELGLEYAMYYNLADGSVGQTMAVTPLSLARYQKRSALLSPR